MKRTSGHALWDEIAYLAYHLHWNFDDLLDLEHRNRARLIGRVRELERRSRDTRATTEDRTP